MGLELARAFVRIRADSSQAAGDIQRSKGGIVAALGGVARSAAGIMATVGIPVGAAAGFASLVRGGEQFNRKMRNSLAIMDDVTGALEDEMKEAAFEAAAATQFSAAQAAESYFFLASAGLDAQQSIAALPQVAQFAQAGMFDMATATDLATDAQSALGLKSDDAQENLANLTRVTDVLVKGNKLANTSVQQLSEAMTNKAGVAARGLGKSIEETSAVLLTMADQGKKGAEAGTGLSIVLRDLQTASRKNEAAFRKANIEVYEEGTGEMRNMADIVQDLENRLGSMSDKQRAAEFAQLGFNDKSKAFIEILIGQSSAIRGYQNDLENAAGFTKKVADSQLTPLQKGVAQLGAAWTKLGSTIMSASGDAVGGALSFFADLVDKTTTFVQEMQFVFRNFSAIAQVAIIDLVMSGLRLFPMLEEPIAQMAAFFVGTWSGVKAFFGTIIETMIGGLKELKNFAQAVGAGIQAAFQAITTGNFTGAAAAFGEAFTRTLAQQQDVQAKNAFAEFGKAFNQAREDTLQTFQERGGFGQFLEEERDRLLNSVAESEQALADARKGKGKAKPPGAPPSEEAEAGAAAGAAFGAEAGRLGFAELGRTIQDQLLGGDVPQQTLKAVQEGVEVNKQQLEEQRRQRGAGGLVAGGDTS